MYRTANKKQIAEDTQKEIRENISGIMMQNDVLIEVATVVRNYSYATWLLEDDVIEELLKQRYLIASITKLVLASAGENRKKLNVFSEFVTEVISKICTPVIKQSRSGFVEEMLVFGIKDRIWAESLVLKTKYLILATHTFKTLDTIKNKVSPALIDTLNKKRIAFIAEYIGPKKEIELWREKNTELLLKIIDTRIGFNFLVTFILLFILLFSATTLFIDLPVWINLLFSILVSGGFAYLWAKTVSNILNYYALTEGNTNDADEKNVTDLPRLTILRALLNSLSLAQDTAEEISTAKIAPVVSKKPQSPLQYDDARIPSVSIARADTRSPHIKSRKKKPCY